MGRSRFALFVGGVIATSSPAFAAPPSKVAILAADASPTGPRLERNLKAVNLPFVRASITICSRDVVTRLLIELQADAALCADGDAVAVWAREVDRVVLKEVIVESGADDRGHEITAARAVIALRNEDADAITIVANGSRPPSSGSAVPVPPPPLGDSAPLPIPEVVKARPRMAPLVVLGAGASAAGSRHGTSVAIDLSAEIGFSRAVALVPWVSFIPVNRVASLNGVGSATFRPTMFGIGFSMPFLPASSIIVPRIGGGYGLVWMHVAPETAVPPSVTRSPEDLVAPMMYASGSVSFAVVSQLRLAVVGMGGLTSHEMIVRLGGTDAAHWGVPFGNLGARGEWVLP